MKSTESTTCDEKPRLPHYCDDPVCQSCGVYEAIIVVDGVFLCPVCKDPQPQPLGKQSNEDVQQPEPTSKTEEDE